MIEQACPDSTGKAEEYTCVRLYLSLLYLMHALSTLCVVYRPLSPKDL